MGQAKRRGTKDQRIAAAIERDQRIAEERERKKAEWWNSLTQEERQSLIMKRRRREETLARIAGYGSMGMFDTAFWGPPRLKRII